MEVKKVEKFKCCLCGNEFMGYGNNPFPLCEPDDYDSRCCDDCNRFVIEARMTQFMGHELTPEMIEDFKERAKEGAE